MNAPQRMPIATIRQGSRFRQDLGDIEGLAASIDEIGLLHPVVVRPDGTLIAGARRLAACKLLGWREIPITVVDITKILRGQHDENVCRKDFTWSEAVAIKRQIEPEEKAAAKERQGTRSDKLPGKLPESSKGQSRDKIAKATGKKARTLAKAEAVIAAAEADPEKFGKLVRDMDESGNVDRAFKQVNIVQARADYEARADHGANIGDLFAMAKARQKFAAIYADPPWEFKVYSSKGKQWSAERYYDTSSVEAIKALPIEKLAAKDCVLCMWAVSPELLGALEVIKAWGFEYKTVGFGWVKQNRGGEGLFTGMGYWTRANLECCLLATRSAPMRLAMDVHQIVMTPIGEHSAKPGEIRSRIQRLLAGPTSNCSLGKQRPAGQAGGTNYGGQLSN